MNKKPVTIYGMGALALLLLNAVILETALVRNPQWYKALALTVPLLVMALAGHYSIRSGLRKKASRHSQTLKSITCEQTTPRSS